MIVSERFTGDGEHVRVQAAARWSRRFLLFAAQFSVGLIVDLFRFSCWHRVGFLCICFGGRISNFDRAKVMLQRKEMRRIVGKRIANLALPSLCYKTKRPSRAGRWFEITNLPVILLRYPQSVVAFIFTNVFLSVRLVAFLGQMSWEGGRHLHMAWNKKVSLILAGFGLLTWVSVFHLKLKKTTMKRKKRLQGDIEMHIHDQMKFCIDIQCSSLNVMCKKILSWYQLVIFYH